MLRRQRFAVASTALLGTALVIFAIAGLAAWRLAVPKAWEPILSPVFADITGLITAAKGSS
jgi:hypothetical protein